MAGALGSLGLEASRGLSIGKGKDKTTVQAEVEVGDALTPMSPNYIATQRTRQELQGRDLEAEIASIPDEYNSLTDTPQLDKDDFEFEEAIVFDASKLTSDQAVGLLQGLDKNDPNYMARRKQIYDRANWAYDNTIK